MTTKPTPIQKRLLDGSVQIAADRAKVIDYQHTTFCQIGLPYRPTPERIWEREQGNVALRVEAGSIRDPKAGRWVDLPLPHGEKPRLILIHLSNEALRSQSPVIGVEDSLTAFARSMGLDTCGRNLRTLKDQVGRLAAATIRLAVVEEGRAVQINGQIVRGFDLWFPPEPEQRILWPTTVRLSADYYDSLTRHSVPLDQRAVAALAHSAMALDVYCWLAQRLHRVPRGRPQAVSWLAVRDQFGSGYAELRMFRRVFIGVLKSVRSQYPDANIEVGRVGVTLRHSPPPVRKRYENGVVIDAKPVEKATE